MTIFLSGPMSGYLERNKPAFRRATEHLRAQGHVVYSPVDHFSTGRILRNRHQVAKAAHEVMPLCDTIALLPGWEASIGAREELTLATTHGAKPLYL